MCTPKSQPRHELVATDLSQSVNSNLSMAASQRIIDRSVAYATPWFDLLAKRIEGSSEPFYCLKGSDYASIVPTTSEGDIVLVRQFRPAVERETLELPSGHIDAGMTPEGAALQELREETGYVTDDLRPIAVLEPDTGRIAHRMWCFWARDVRPPAPDWQPEAGLRVELCSPRALRRYIQSGDFNHALHLAVLMAFLVDVDPGILSAIVPLPRDPNKETL